jgi:hypothetical protein
MTRTTRLATTLATLLLASCASLAPEIRVQSTADDLARLTGKWSGEYRHYSPAQRRGTIRFELVSGEDHAHGSVTMTLPRSGVADGPRRLSYAGAEDPPRSRVLSIRFVVARVGFVEGALEPYRDPDTNDETWTTFHGEIRGDRIEGWFVSRTSTSAEVTRGAWRVSRERERGRVGR